MKVKDIFNYLCERAPLELQMDFDNSGLLVGDPEEEVSTILIALDITSQVIDEAISNNADLIISHHPVIWDPMKQILTTDPQQRKVIQLIKNNIAAICMHTNLDIVDGGVNDKLAALLGIHTTDVLERTDTVHGCGRIGYLDKPIAFNDFLNNCKCTLNVNGLRYYNATDSVHKVAVMGGSGGNELTLASKAGCDTYVTADIKYDIFLLAKELGINLIDADHFSTENPVTEVLYDWLTGFLEDTSVIISKVHSPTARFYS